MTHKTNTNRRNATYRQAKEFSTSNMMPQWFRSILAATLLFTACSSDQNNDRQAPKQGSAKGFASPPAAAGDAALYAPITEPGVPVAPGSAIDFNNHKGIPNLCLDGTVVDVPQQEGFFALDAEYSRQDVERILGTSAGGGVNFLRWGASARANFSYASRMQSNAINFLVFAYNKHHSKVFQPTARKEAWKITTPEEWNTSCGAGYVAAQDYGSMLLVRFSLTLDKSASNGDFGSSGSANFLSFAKLRASISANQKVNQAHGTLSVAALQIGGKPEELGKILKRDGEAQASSNPFPFAIFQT